MLLSNVNVTHQSLCSLRCLPTMIFYSLPFPQALCVHSSRRFIISCHSVFTAAIIPFTLLMFQSFSVLLSGLQFCEICPIEHFSLSATSSAITVCMKVGCKSENVCRDTFCLFIISTTFVCVLLALPSLLTS